MLQKSLFGVCLVLGILALVYVLSSYTQPKNPSKTSNNNQTSQYSDQTKVLVCSQDTDCGVNICDCKAMNKYYISGEDKICTRHCMGTPKCIDSQCLLVKEEVKIDYYTCSQDKECVSIRDGECGCNAGGKATAINKKYENEWEARHPAGYCPAVMSNDWSCIGTLPKCIQNKCQLVKDSG